MAWLTDERVVGSARRGLSPSQDGDPDGEQQRADGPDAPRGALSRFEVDTENAVVRPGGDGEQRARRDQVYDTGDDGDRGEDAGGCGRSEHDPAGERGHKTAVPTTPGAASPLRRSS
jgi:hypothetical protein